MESLPKDFRERSTFLAGWIEGLSSRDHAFFALQGNPPGVS